MSRLFPERLAIGLSPTEISVGDKRIACDPAYGAEPWHGPIAVLQGLQLSGRATVILSNHFVRYALVPWSDALSSAAEEEAYVRHHFARIHGERAKSWAVRASPAAAGEPRLCSAIDTNLLNAIRDCFSGSKAKLVSVQPALMAAFNRARKSLPAAGAWLVLAEADRACVSLYAGGRWRSVQNARGSWEELLERERHRAGGEIPETVVSL